MKKTLYAISLTLLLSFIIASCKDDSPSHTQGEAQTTSVQSDLEILDSKSVKSNEAYAIQIDPEQRYLFVADYTEPAAVGYVPFCLLDFDGIKCDKVFFHVKYLSKEKTTDVVINIEFMLGESSIGNMEFTRTTVAGIKYLNYSKIKSSRISQNITSHSFSEFGKLGQKSTLIAFSSKSIEDLKSTLKVSASAPFWKWRAEKLAKRLPKEN